MAKKDTELPGFETLDERFKNEAPKRGPEDKRSPRDQ